MTNWYGHVANIIANTGTISNAVGYYVNDITTGTVTRARSFVNDDPDAPITSKASICDGSIQTFLSPGTGATLTIVKNKTLVVILDVPLAALTLSLPASATVEDGQQFEFFTQSAITTLTVNGNGTSVFGAPSTLGALSSFRLRYYQPGPYWLRMS